MDVYCRIADVSGALARAVLCLLFLWSLHICVCPEPLCSVCCYITDLRLWQMPHMKLPSHSGTTVLWGLSCTLLIQTNFAASMLNSQVTICTVMWCCIRIFTVFHTERWWPADAVRSPHCSSCWPNVVWNSLAFIYREALSSFVRDIRVWWMEEITSKRPHGKVFPACYKWWVIHIGSIPHI